MTFQNCMKLINIANMNIEPYWKRCCGAKQQIKWIFLRCIAKNTHMKMIISDAIDFMPELHFITQPFHFFYSVQMHINWVECIHFYSVGITKSKFQLKSSVSTIHFVFNVGDMQITKTALCHFDITFIALN